MSDRQRYGVKLCPLCNLTFPFPALAALEEYSALLSNSRKQQSAWAWWWNSTKPKPFDCGAPSLTNMRNSDVKIFQWNTSGAMRPSEGCILRRAEVHSSLSVPLPHRSRVWSTIIFADLSIPGLTGGMESASVVLSSTGTDWAIKSFSISFTDTR